MLRFTTVNPTLNKGNLKRFGVGGGGGGGEGETMQWLSWYTTYYRFWTPLPPPAHYSTRTEKQTRTFLGKDSAKTGREARG